MGKKKKRDVLVSEDELKLLNADIEERDPDIRRRRGPGLWVLLVVALFSVFFFILGRFSVRKKAEIPLSPVSVAETESKEKASATEPQAPEKVHAVTQGLPPEKQAEPEKLVQPDPAQLPLGDEASFTSWMLSHTPQTSPFLSWKWAIMSGR